jgi:hypothetical protein
MKSALRNMALIFLGCAAFISQATSAGVAHKTAAAAAAQDAAPGGPLKPSGPIVIDHKKDVVIENVQITTTEGDCIRVENSKNITIRNSEIGPCGGDGIRIDGGSGVHVLDSYIHPETLSPGCCDHNDGIFALETTGLLVQGNVIAYGESNVEVHGGSEVTVKGNLLLNPRGPEHSRGNNFQCWSHNGQGNSPWCKDITVDDNYALSSTDTDKYTFPEATQDSINFGYTNGAVAENNFIAGGHSKSGCGLIADKGANNTIFTNNRLLDAGQCGIGIADGIRHVVDGNKVLNRTPIPGSGNQGIYVWRSYHEKGNCSDSTVTNNISLALKPDGSKSGFWKGEGCDPLQQQNNTFGPAAESALRRVDQIFQPPLIPPRPYACVATSPYSNQTGFPPCHQ